MKKFLFVFCLSLISGYGFADIASTKYVDDVVGALSIPTYSNMGAATASAAGSAGLVPAPRAGDQDKFLKGDGTWTDVSASSASYTAGTGISITDGTISNSGVSKVRIGGSTATTFSDIWIE